MADVLELANERRGELQQELSTLDDFIRMAESLIRGERSGSRASEAGMQLAGE